MEKLEAAAGDSTLACEAITGMYIRVLPSPCHSIPMYIKTGQ
ncbi:hypothetical protein ACFLX6_01005 [Chloroflexota bacterium]